MGPLVAQTVAEAQSSTAPDTTVIGDYDSSSGGLISWSPCGSHCSLLTTASTCLPRQALDFLGLILRRAEGGHFPV